MPSKFRIARLAAGLAVAIVCGSAAAQSPQLMLTPPSSASAQSIAEDFLIQSAGRLGLVQTDLEYRRLEGSYVTRHNRVSHEFFQQYIDGVPVYKAIFQVNVLPDGRVLNSTSGFEANIRARASALQPALTVQQALVAAAAHFGIQGYVVPTPESVAGGRQQQARFAGGNLSESPIDTELVFEPVNGELRLAWRLVVDRYSAHTQHLDMRFDALTGELLAQDDWVNFFSPEGNISPQGVSVPYNAEYRASPFPTESPGHPGGLPVLVLNPWETNASPSGWQDTRTNPPAGQPESLYTRGNNVRAQLDLSANNNDLDANRALGVWDAGSSTLTFDFPWVASEDPASDANRLASVVNLFYWNNIIHDVLWQYGFDEPSGNFQDNNFGRGGSGNDPVRADALDGSGTDNANFSTPADGTSGRMQMFRWTAPGGVEIDAPFAATYTVAVPGDWGGAFTELAGNIVPVNSPGTGDGSGIDGCNTPYTNAASVSGKIALVRRGGCEFGLKALNAQLNGAVGVIIFNSATGVPGGMGAGVNGPSVTIPVMGLMEYDIGTNIATVAASEAVHGTLKAKLYPDRDSDFDAGIMAHEYGHGVSNRLTGGVQAGCLPGGSEQAGEGWSDFYALHFTLTDAVCDVPRGVGTYPSFEGTDGLGIRQYRYTRDMTINPHTFADVALARISTTTGLVVPHDVGEVWNTMLWDMSCNLMQKRGVEPDIYTTEGGNGLAIQLVTDGLKLQGCRPTFVMARNGILAADAAMAVADPSYQSEKCLVWKTFARRGLGANASSGTFESHTDQTQDFSVPAECASYGQVKVVVTGPGTTTPSGLFVTPAFSESLDIALTPGAGASIQSVEGCDGELDGSTYTTDLVVDSCTVRVQFTDADYLFGDGAE